MANGKWTFLHRSEEYIYYYRRAIPQFLRQSFNNKWEIKRSLRTRDKSLAILRHNELNIKVERLLERAEYGGHMSEESLESLNLKLKARMDQEAINNHGGLDTMLSGVILALRGRPAHEAGDKSKIISPIHVEVKGNHLVVADGGVISNFIIAVALQLAEELGIPPNGTKLSI